MSEEILCQAVVGIILLERKRLAEAAALSKNGTRIIVSKILVSQVCSVVEVSLPGF